MQMHVFYSLIMVFQRVTYIPKEGLIWSQINAIIMVETTIFLGTMYHF